MFKKILVLLGGSELGRMCVLPYIDAIAKECNVRSITFICMVEPIQIPFAINDYGYTLDAKDLVQIQEEFKARIEHYLTELTGKVEYNGINITSEVLTGGQTADIITEYAVKNGITLIIDATRRRSGIGRWILGSVADRVLHSSGIPVLTVRVPGSVPSEKRK